MRCNAPGAPPAPGPRTLGGSTRGTAPPTSSNCLSHTPSTHRCDALVGVSLASCVTIPSLNRTLPLPPTTPRTSPATYVPSPHGSLRDIPWFRYIPTSVHLRSCSWVSSSHTQTHRVVSVGVPSWPVRDERPALRLRLVPSSWFHRSPTGGAAFALKNLYTPCPPTRGAAGVCYESPSALCLWSCSPALLSLIVARAESGCREEPRGAKSAEPRRDASYAWPSRSKRSPSS